MGPLPYWIKWSSHTGLNGNEIADSLGKSATAEALRDDACLTFAELSSIKRMELNALCRVSLLTLFWKKNLLVSITIFLGIVRRLYRAILVATSRKGLGNIILNRAGNSFQNVIGARLIRPPPVIFLID
ncbi:hypothetical protein TNCV_195091 [Trichonephila clavipes]|uniref:RNase H type-1 domain-containing protein n=1 Tax=Trichonephila clavipes TaxID=2585209 RepID=A0A8X7BKL7_TRICX|nr:hypothetical protein TNCV_195091 [Trichonephila clavipes]